MKPKPENAANETWPVSFDSMSACSAATGIPLGVLKAWKRDGCPAFRPPRVFPAAALRWFFDRKVKSALDYNEEKTRLTKALADEKERENKLADGESMQVDDVRDYLRDTWQPVREVVIPMADVLAPLVNPSDPEHARVHLLEWRDELFKRCTLKLPELIKAREETTAPDKV